MLGRRYRRGGVGLWGAGAGDLSPLLPSPSPPGLSGRHSFVGLARALAQSSPPGSAHLGGLQARGFVRRNPQPPSPPAEKGAHCVSRWDALSMCDPASCVQFSDCTPLPPGRQAGTCDTLTAHPPLGLREDEKAPKVRHAPQTRVQVTRLRARGLLRRRR